MTGNTPKTIAEKLQGQVASNLKAAKYIFDTGENIRKVVFTSLKNLQPSCELIIESPLTVLVGSNGTNKSTVLKSIHGCVNQVSISRYWFSTEVDPIQEKPRPEYTYFYNNTEYGEIFDIRQMRTVRKNDPDYWETQKNYNKKLTELYGKERLPKIAKPSLYINCKYEENPFERIILGKFKISSKLSNQDYLRARSKNLGSFVKNPTKLKRKDKHLFSVTLLSKDIIEAVSYILSRSYDEIKCVRHSYFAGFNYSFIIKNNGMNYSEALAGSGETAVMLLVSQIEECENGSLIMLDEPEFSLHPSAQKKLIEYLAYKCKSSGHQIFVSTHSTHMVESLSPESIRLLYFIGDKVSIRSANAFEAFNNIGASFIKPTILVEDILSRRVIEVVASNAGAEYKDALDVNVCPGGESDMILKYMPVMSQSNGRAYFLSDGDKNKNLPFREDDKIPDSDIDGYLKNILGGTPLLNKNSNETDSSPSRIKHKRDLINFIYRNLDYLPFDTPEKLIVEAHLEMKNADMMRIYEKLKSEKNDIRIWKETIKEYAREKGGQLEGELPTSNDIFETQKRLLKEIPKEYPAFIQLKAILDKIVERASLR